MSERIGMADGRCLTGVTSSRIAHDFILREKGIPYQDGHKARMAFQQMAPEDLTWPLPNAACKGGLACLSSPVVSNQNC
jgi:hypothetical protein